VKRLLAATALLTLLMPPFQGALAQEAPREIDMDGDGLTNGEEDANSNHMLDTGETDPRNADTDGGGEADGSEIRGKRNPLDKNDDLTFDGDGDGLTNADEQELGTDPTKADSDSDGAQDSVDPFPLDDSYKVDADKDRLPDEWEKVFGLSTSGSSDTDTDLDGDGLTNIEEFQQGTSPLSNDSDRDGVTDAQELQLGTDPGESACFSYKQGAIAFGDLANHWARPSVEALQRTIVAPFAQPIVRGYPAANGDFLFLPDKAVTRFELLKMALFSTCIALLPESQFGDVSFTDVPKNGRPREEEDKLINRRIIFTAARFGIVEGYKDPEGGPSGRTFRPDAPVTRAEALKILLAASQLPLHALPEEGDARTFSDVSADDWFSSTVDQAVRLGLIEGYEDGSFRPQASITRAEAAKLTHFILIGNPLVNGYVLPQEDDAPPVPQATTGTGVTLRSEI
jgi:hypothetical protein